MVWRCRGIPFLWDSEFLFFLFRTNGKKNIWMRVIPVTVMIVILKVPFWKLLDITYVQSSFSTITRHIDNGIWKTPCSWRFYRHGSTWNQKNLVFKFNLVLIEKFSPQFIYLFTFQYSAYLEVIQCFYAFFIRTSKISMRLLVFFEALQPQTVLIMFLFSMKHSYLLKAKITHEVNNSL